MNWGLAEFRRSFNKTRKYGQKLKPNEYKRIIETYYKLVVDRIIFDNYDYTLGGAMDIGMRKTKMIGVPGKRERIIGYTIDHNASKKLGRRVLHENEHTNGFVFKIKLIRMRMVRNIKFYKFRPERWHVKRRLSHILKNQDIYGVIDAFQN
jgi:hypothetical protein